MKYLIAITLILTSLCLISTGIAISSVKSLESARELVGDVILSGRTSQVFNEDGDDLVSDKNLTLGTTTRGAGDLNIWAADGSTTINIGNAANVGCIIFGDTNTGLTYVYATNGTITASGSNPGYCK